MGGIPVFALLYHGAFGAITESLAAPSAGIWRCRRCATSACLQRLHMHILFIYIMTHDIYPGSNLSGDLALQALHY